MRRARGEGELTATYVPETQDRRPVDQIGGMQIHHQVDRARGACFRISDYACNVPR